MGQAFMVNSNSRPAEVFWKDDRAEMIADGIVHVIGVSLGLVGAIAITIVTANSRHASQIPSIVVYSVGLLSMLGFSAAYNMWPVSRVKSVLRRLDHSAIFLMIAGTYTAFIAQMKADLVAMGLLIGVWLTAVAGIILKVLLPGRFDRLAVVLYLLLGWSGVVIYEPVVSALPSLSAWLLVAGGALYSVGVIFYSWLSLRFQNAIWHAFVLVAACCHYAAVLFCVANGST
jgi:hemolysin III